jgi:hypothetical protein
LPPEQRHAPMRKEYQVNHVKQNWIEPRLINNLIRFSFSYEIIFFLYFSDFEFFLIISILIKYSIELLKSMKKFYFLFILIVSK